MGILHHSFLVCCTEKIGCDNGSIQKTKVYLWYTYKDAILELMKITFQILWMIHKP